MGRIEIRRKKIIKSFDLVIDYLSEQIILTLATFCMIAGGGGGFALWGGGAGPDGGGGGGGWLGGLIGGGCDGLLMLIGAGGALVLGLPMVAESVLTGGGGTSSPGAGEPRTLKLAARLTLTPTGGGGGGFIVGRPLPLPPEEPGGLDVGGGGGFFREFCIEGLALGLNEGVDVCNRETEKVTRLPVQSWFNTPSLWMNVVSVMYIVQ